MKSTQTQPDTWGWLRESISRLIHLIGSLKMKHYLRRTTVHLSPSKDCFFLCWRDIENIAKTVSRLIN